MVMSVKHKHPPHQQSVLIVRLLVSDYLYGDALSVHVGLTHSRLSHLKLGPAGPASDAACDIKRIQKLSDIQLFYAQRNR